MAVVLGRQRSSVRLSTMKQVGAWNRLILCASWCFLMTVVHAALPYGTNISALPLHLQYLYTCKGVVLTYTTGKSLQRILPISLINATQPYKFEASGTLTNAGYSELRNWELYIGFQHGEVIAEAPGVVIGDGSQILPGALVGNGTTLTGTDNPDLLTSIDTAEDFQLIQVKYQITGTEFGVGPGQPIDIPLPKNISLTNTGYDCSKPAIEANVTMVVCCKENSTDLADSASKKWLPREKGDITMYYDVVKTFDQQYTAQVTISLDQEIGRIDHWNLTWDWLYDEYIQGMKGAQTLEQDQEQCLNGPQAELNPGADFSSAMSCQKTPTIVDLSLEFASNGDMAVPFCCRNGSLLPKIIAPAMTKSVFTLDVQKGRLQKGKTKVDPPANWRIGDLNKGASTYTCGLPRLVAPSEWGPDPGLHYSSAAITWQVTCNQTLPDPSTPRKCCVSFSGFYNSSVVPCPSCACGDCKKANPTCDPNAESMLLPTYGLLLPPSNRTALALELARIDKFNIPNPLPCPDNCGVTINWHIYSDFAKGYSTRITLFNWEAEAVADWFLALDLGKALAGYQDVYSFNGSEVTTLIDNKQMDLVFMKGKKSYNDYLLGLEGGITPGKVQSIMSFNKRLIPGINVTGGDGFPKRVWFNGDECQLPDIFPIESAGITILPSASGLLLASTLVIAIVVGLI